MFYNRKKQILTVLLALAASTLVGCGDDETPPPGGPAPGPGPIVGSTIKVSGRVTFDSVPVTPANGLNYSQITAKPARGIYIQAKDADTSELIASSAASTNEEGRFTLEVPKNRKVKILALAQLRARSEFPSWDIRVVNPTDSERIYSIESSEIQVAEAELVDQNLHATLGWNATSYTAAARNAAPFAIADTAFQTVRELTRDFSARATLNLPELNIHWSSSSETYAHYDLATNAIRLRGKENSNTDEFDRHVIAKEVAHFFLDHASRSDSLGGAFTFNARLDARNAYSEGLSTALASFILGDSVYKDTSGATQGTTSTSVDIENNLFNEANEGWYSPVSIAALIYDLLDAANEGAHDTASLSLAQLTQLLAEDMPAISSFATIYSFSAAFKAKLPAHASALNSLLDEENISSSSADQWDSTRTETNQADDLHSIPIYIRLVPRSEPFTGDPFTKNPIDGDYVQLCSDGLNGNFNHLRNRNLFYVEVATAGTYTLRSDPDPRDNLSAPSIVLYRQGREVARSRALNPANSADVGKTIDTSVTLAPGIYTGEMADVSILGSQWSQRCTWISLISN